MHQTLDAVVVGHSDLGESDRIVRLLTAEEGRIDLVARGARASRKRFGGILDAGNRIRVERRRTRGELAVLESADVLALPRRARGDYDRLVALGYGLEVVASLAGPHQRADKLFRLATVWLDLLEGEVTPGAASRVALEAKALTFAGVAPALVTCPVCGLALEGEVRLDPEEGGGVHSWCSQQGQMVAATTLAAIEALRRTPLSDTPSLDLPTEGAWHLADFIEHHLGRALRARALLQPERSLPPRS